MSLKIRDMMEIKKRDNLSVTVGMQMVLMPEDGDQIIPLAKLGKELSLIMLLLNIVQTMKMVVWVLIIVLMKIYIVA